MNPQELARQALKPPPGRDGRDTAGLLERVRRGNPHAEAMYMRKQAASP